MIFVIFELFNFICARNVANVCRGFVVTVASGVRGVAPATDIFVAAVVVISSKPRASGPVAPGRPCADQRIYCAGGAVRKQLCGMAYPQEWRIVLYSTKRPLSGAVLTYSIGEILAGGGPCCLAYGHHSRGQPWRGRSDVRFAPRTRGPRLKADCFGAQF